MKGGRQTFTFSLYHFMVALFILKDALKFIPSSNKDNFNAHFKCVTHKNFILRTCIGTRMTKAYFKFHKMGTQCSWNALGSVVEVFYMECLFKGRQSNTLPITWWKTKGGTLVYIIRKYNRISNNNHKHFMHFTVPLPCCQVHRWPW